MLNYQYLSSDILMQNDHRQISFNYEINLNIN